MREYKSVYLPDSMQPVVAAVGPYAAAEIVKTYGGTQLYIPVASGLTENHGLARALTLRLAVKLSLAFGGQVLNVPTCRWTKGNVRNEEILRRRKSETIAQIALALGMTERSVYRIIKGSEHVASEGENVAAHR